MIELSREQLASLSAWFIPERPAIFALHVLHTGQGACFADRWPDPRALLVTVGSIGSLLGDASAFNPAALQRRAGGLMFMEPHFLPVVEAAFPNLTANDSLHFELRQAPAVSRRAPGVLRRLERGDASHLATLSPDCTFISSTWGGPAGLAASGHGWGCFIHGTLAAVACTFLVGRETEDIGVATEVAYRGRGLAVAAAGRLCKEIQSRGRLPTWTTSPQNAASIRVAEKLGFTQAGTELLYVLNPPAAP